jgi:hypothetical protein
MASYRGLWLALTAAAVVLSNVAHAQGADSAAVLVGRVIAAGAPLSGVEVAIQGSQGSIMTDSAGRFRLIGLRPGRQIVLLRRLGYAPRRDTVVLAPGTQTERTYTLEPVPTQLDTVVTAAGEVKYISPRLQDFENRRKRNVGGYFISEADLRRDEHASMPAILRRFPGMGIVPHRSHFHVRTRGAGSVKGDPPLDGPGSPRGCWATVYVDGALIFDISMMGGVASLDPPDVGQFFALNLSGIEYYSSAGSTPLQYKTARSNCGTLLFWTRGR